MGDIDEYLGCLVWIVGTAIVSAIAVAAGWFVTPFPGLWTDKNPAFIAACSEPYMDDTCPGREVTSEAITFRANRETGEVALLSYGGGKTKMGVEKNCTIYDTDNWFCPAFQFGSMIDGNFVLNPLLLRLPIRVVSRWRYKYLRVKEWFKRKE